MNILYVTNHLDIGGITTYVLTLALGMKKKGHNIYLASSGGTLLPRFQEAGINFIPIPIRTKSEASPKIILSMWKLSGIIRRNNIQLLHSHTRTTQVLGCWLCARTGIPHVSTCHGYFKRRLFRLAFGCWGKRVIAISEQVKEHLVKDFGVEENRIAVIHSGVDVERFRVQSTEYRVQGKQKYGLGDGPVIGIVARLSEEKGHEFLIQAMPQVLSIFPQAQLLIVGGGRTERKIKGLVKELNLGKSIFFVPAVTDTAQVLALMDIFVLPSLKEGLGLSLIEAMAAGCPVIGSRIGGIKSLIKDGVNGLLVRAQDAAALAKAILELLQDKDKAAAFGGAARVFIKDNFSEQEMVNETERVYRECLSVKD